MDPHIDRLQRFDALAHAVEDREGQPAADLVALEEAPEGLAGDAEPLRRVPVAAPLGVFVQVSAEPVDPRFVSYEWTP